MPLSRTSVFIGVFVLQGVLEADEILGSSVFLGMMEDEGTGASFPHFALDISGINDHLFRAFHPEAEALIDRRGVFTLGKGSFMLERTRKGEFSLISI